MWVSGLKLVGVFCRGSAENGDAVAQMKLSVWYVEGMSRPIAVHRCAVDSSRGIWRCCLSGLQSLDTRKEGEVCPPPAHPVIDFYRRHRHRQIQACVSCVGEISSWLRWAGRSEFTFCSTVADRMAVSSDASWVEKVSLRRRLVFGLSVWSCERDIRNTWREFLLIWHK